MARLPTQINVLAELEHFGIEFEWAGDNEVKTRCPFHEDNSPSAAINIEKRLFHCHTSGCGAKGDFVTFLSGALKTTRVVVQAELGKRYALSDTKVVSADLVEEYHRRIWNAKPLITELYKRGVSDDLIRKYRLGEDKGRVTIPIRNEAGLFVNIRKYLPGAPGGNKMLNQKGYGRIRLFPVEQLRYDEIVICGGEVKAIVAASQLNAFGIGAITATAGEGNWDTSLTPAFAGKKVWVCQDVDKDGQAGAQAKCALLKRTVRWIGNIVLPLDIDKYPHGDINDFVAQEHGDLKPLLDACEEWKPVVKASQLDANEPLAVELFQAMNAKYAGKRITVPATIAAMDTAPYAIPSKVQVECDKSQQQCPLCPVVTHDQDVHELHEESICVLEMVGNTRHTQRESLMRAIGIPPQCNVCQFKTLDYFNVEDVRVSPQLEITSRTAERVMQPALCIGKGLELNESYELTGRMYPHPKTQQSTLLISAYTPTKDALSTYEPRDLETLEIFRPLDWTDDLIGGRLNDLYSDFETNVTRIFQRRDLHLLVDLAYHSPLLIPFDEKVIKGWVEVLVVGDSAQGKTETAVNMMQHYGLGEKVECKNATVAGLLGGLQQMGTRWFVTWGVIPTHDKRLVILEELKGASTDVIGKLTDMRSSGFAEIPKIEKRRTHARTRLIALSNPRSDLPMSAYNFGIEAVKELIGGLEDIRRFDAITIVNRKDVDGSVINELSENRPKVEHLHTRELCRELILWAWTREPKDITFDYDTTRYIMEESTKLGEEFTDAIPIIDRGSTRNKIARLAASLAARTFSTGDNLGTIRVRRCHAEFICRLLRRMYTSPAFGYGDFSDAIKLSQNISDTDVVKGKLNSVPFPRDFIKQTLHKSQIDLQDICDWCAWDRQDATDMLSFLVRKHALVREGRIYRKTPPFIELLKGMLENGCIKDRPDFIKEEY